MVARLAQWTLDVQDVERMARFWSAALGYRVGRGSDRDPFVVLADPEGDEFCVLRRDPRAGLTAPAWARTTSA